AQACRETPSRDSAAQAGTPGVEEVGDSDLHRTRWADGGGVGHRRGRTRPTPVGSVVGAATNVTGRRTRPAPGAGGITSAFRAPDVDAGSRRQDRGADPERGRG